jgi:hypothetical protein
LAKKITENILARLAQKMLPNKMFLFKGVLSNIICLKPTFYGPTGPIPPFYDIILLLPFIFSFELEKI